MIFQDLKRGDFFMLEGQPYEVQTLGERIILAYVCEFYDPSATGLESTPYELNATHVRRIPDPDDLAGTEFLTTAFSDLRFNREHETPEDAARFEDLL